MFASGTVTSVLGANGSGKSSLLKCLAGLVPYDGKIRTTPDNFGKISYVPQRPIVPVGMTLAEFVLLGRSEFTKWYFSETSTDRAKCQEAITSLSLGELAGRFVETLSGGEFQRAVLARAVAQEASVLLLDEPTVGLDIGSRQTILKHVKNLCKVDNLAVLWATHLIDEIDKGEKVVIIDKGKILEKGDVESIVKRNKTKNIREAFNKLVKI